MIDVPLNIRRGGSRLQPLLAKDAFVRATSAANKLLPEIRP
ncbi:MAG TPA: hypothetical protein VD840_01650 [Sinorhizobium sp.]|nr:hypothetical protein [Sinorhizobium sp.]